MKLNKLSSRTATPLFQNLVSISVAKTSLKEKFSNKEDRHQDSLKAILFSAIFDVLKESNVQLKPKTAPVVLLNSIIQAAPLGEGLSEDILKVYNRIIAVAYDKVEESTSERIIVDESLYLDSVKTIAEFIAVLSRLPVPEDLQNIINGTTAINSSSSDDKNKVEDEVTVDDLNDNPTTRVPVVLCLDVSASMTIDNRIDQLNQGVQEFFRSVSEDHIARYSAEICIVTFGSEAQKLIDFNYADRQKAAFAKMTLQAKGNTAMGAAVEMSLSLLDARKKEYQEKGIDYWQPWLVLMTDGQATDNIDTAVARCQELVGQGKLVIFPLALGKGANLKQLELFSPKRPPMRINEHKMSEFFNWLSQSVRTTSQSTLGDRVNLPDISAWTVL